MARDLVRPHVAVAESLRLDADFDSVPQREAVGQRDAEGHAQPKAMIAMLEKTNATPTPWSGRKRSCRITRPPNSRTTGLVAATRPPRRTGARDTPTAHELNGIASKHRTAATRARTRWRR